MLSQVLTLLRKRESGSRCFQQNDGRDVVSGKGKGLFHPQTKHEVKLNKKRLFYKKSMEEARWEAVSPASCWSIPMFRADFLDFALKIVEHSRYLLPFRYADPHLVNALESEQLLPSNVSSCPQS